MARIVMQLPGGKVQEHPLTRTARIGRHPEQDLQILDPLVSKAHILIERIADDWYLRDLDSRNGTWLNGERVFGRTALNHNDRIKIGTTAFVFSDRDERPPLRPSGQVKLGNPSSSEIDVARLREGATEYLPADLVADSVIMARDYERLRLGRLLQRQIGPHTRLDLLLPTLIEHLFTIFNGDRGAILLLTDSGELVPRAVAARGLETSDEAIQLSHGLLTSVMDSRSAVLSRDSRTEGPTIGPGQAQGNTRSSMCAPLIAREGVPLGVIHLESISVANAFSERDLGSFFALAEVAAQAIEDARHIAKLEKEAAQRAELARLVSIATTDRIIRGELEVQEDAETRDVTVLWLDLRDVVSAGDLTGIQVFTKQLLSQLIDIVNSLDGTVERAGGQGLVAVWGAPVEILHGAIRAQRCAAALSHAITEYNSQRTRMGSPAIGFGVGITAGMAVAGVPRWASGARFTVVGAPMNTAAYLARLADNTETLATEVIRRLSPNVFQRSQRRNVTPDDLPCLEAPLVLWVATTEAIGPRGRSVDMTIDGFEAPPWMAKRDTY